MFTKDLDLAEKLRWSKKYYKKSSLRRPRAASGKETGKKTIENSGKDTAEVKSGGFSLKDG